MLARYVWQTLMFYIINHRKTTPRHSFIKLNFDGSIKNSEKAAARFNLFRDKNGSS